MYNRFIKKLLDFFVALLLFPLFLISFIFIAPAILIDDGFPILYCGDRIGLYGKRFRMWKYRSMTKNAPDIRTEDNSTFNSENDSRVTRAGKILRATSLDELPQIINVLFGNMSFVGPRPHIYIEPIEKLPMIEQRRLVVRPGITGYNQVYFRNAVSREEKFKNDLVYVDNMSFILDTKIMLKTFLSVLIRNNLYNLQEKQFNADMSEAQNTK